MKVFLLAFCFLANLSYSIELIKVCKPSKKRLCEFLKFYEFDTSADTSIGEQAKEMAACLRNIQVAAIELTRKEMIAQGTGKGKITCLRGHWPHNASVWQAEYPTEPKCFYEDEQITVEYEAKLVSTETFELTEQEKQIKLTQCEQYLAELEAESAL